MNHVVITDIKYYTICWMRKYLTDQIKNLKKLFYTYRQ